MKQLVENYTFNKTSKTVTFTDFATIDLDRILLVTDVTRNVIIYNFADPATGGTVATNVLTLTYNTNTGSFADADKLQIFYEVASGDPYQDRPLKVDGSGVTQPVSLSGVATAANQSSELTKLDTLHDDVDGLETAVASTNTKLDTVHSDLAAIDAGVPASLGQGVMSASMPVVLASDQTAVATAASGSVAHDAVDSGNPIKTGGQARTTNPTAVADADRTNFIADKLGKQVVVGAIRDLKANQQTTITSSTAETTVVTAVSGAFLDLYGLIITNTSSLGTKVTIKDATAGTTRFVFWVPANDTRGFMLNESAAVKQATVNNNWTATAGTAVSSLEITALTVQNV